MIIVLVLIILFFVRRRNNKLAPSDTVTGAEIDPVRINMKEVILQSFSGTVYAGELKVWVSNDC